MMKKHLFITTALAVFTLQGCNSIQQIGERNSFLPKEAESAANLYVGDSLKKIDLVSLIDPENRRFLIPSRQCQQNNPANLGNPQNRSDQADNPDYLRDNFFDSYEDIDIQRNAYLKESYDSVVRALTQLDADLAFNTKIDPESYDEIPLTSDEVAERERRRNKLLKRKKQLEKEARKFGLELEKELERQGGYDSDIELSCAIQAFSTYFLSKEQFNYLSVVINDDIYNQRSTINTGSDNSNIPYNNAKNLLKDGLNDYFYSYAAKSIALAIRRNKIQDQILAHSEYYCMEFKNSLQDQAIKVNLFGNAADISLASLATVFTDPATIRGLIGGSLIASGLQSSYNEAYFEDLAAQTVIAGIDVRRELLLRNINRKRLVRVAEDPFDGDEVLRPEMQRDDILYLDAIEYDEQTSDTPGDDTDTSGDDTDTPGDDTDTPGDDTDTPGDDTDTPGDDTDTSGDKTTQTALSNQLEYYAVAQAQERLKSLVSLLNTYDNIPSDAPYSAKIMNRLTGMTDTVTLHQQLPSDDPFPSLFTANFQDDEAGAEDASQKKNGASTKNKNKNEYLSTRGEKINLSSIAVYSLEESLRDSIVFHSNCSIYAGLDQAKDSLSQSRKTSLEKLKESFSELSSIMDQSQGLNDKLKPKPTTSPPPDEPKAPKPPAP